jgi:hypothetical protein
MQHAWTQQINLDKVVKPAQKTMEPLNLKSEVRGEPVKPKKNAQCWCSSIESFLFFKGEREVQVLLYFKGERKVQVLLYCEGKREWTGTSVLLFKGAWEKDSNEQHRRTFFAINIFFAIKRFFFRN